MGTNGHQISHSGNFMFYCCLSDNGEVNYVRIEYILLTIPSEQIGARILTGLELTFAKPVCLQRRPQRKLCYFNKERSVCLLHKYRRMILNLSKSIVFLIKSFCPCLIEIGEMS